LSCGFSKHGWKPAESLFDSASASDPDVALDMNDTMNIIYSSGTTGVPKGIEFIQACPGAEGLLLTSDTRAQTRGFFNYVASN
jgi:acyl-CoA synthetase (AMP-forming)/AMP-acid ligase II